MQTIKFKLNAVDNISLDIDVELEKLLCCDMGLFFFESDSYKLLISRDSIRMVMATLKGLLNLTIKHELKLDHSINKNIGYLWNEELSEDNSALVHDEEECWIGEDYLWVSARSNDNLKTATWLYNSDEGEIILEITPVYKWHFDDPETGEAYITYEEFMLNYKPILFRTISKAVAQEWVDQAQNLLNIIERNTLAAESLEVEQNE